MDAVVDSAQAGPARLQLLARQSGTYSLMLVSNLQEALGSGPIQVNCDCRLPLGCSQGKLLCLVPFHKAHSSALCLSTRQIALHCAFPEGNLVCIVPFHQANSSAPACLAFHLSVLSQLMHWLLQHTMCPVHVSAETSDNACDTAVRSVLLYHALKAGGCVAGASCGCTCMSRYQHLAGARQQQPKQWQASAHTTSWAAYPH